MIKFNSINRIGKHLGSCMAACLRPSVLAAVADLRPAAAAVRGSAVYASLVLQSGIYGSTDSRVDVDGDERTTRDESRR
jgi:hypothetical protein